MGRNERALYQKPGKYDPSFGKKAIIATSNIPMDVIIPMVKKDLETAELTVETTKKLVNHKIGTIFVISPPSPRIEAFCKKHGCKWVNEDDILPNASIKKQGGWIIQQFLKLNADTLAHHEHYLVVDADTFFLRPQIFMKNDDTYLLNVHWDMALVRRRTTAHLLGNKTCDVYDLVPHHMFFSKKIVRAMKKHIEKRFNAPWDQAIVQEMNKDTQHRSGFSEYDLYVTYLTHFHKPKFQFMSSANITVHRNLLPHIERIIPAYAQEYKSISMHSFIKF